MKLLSLSAFAVLALVATWLLMPAEEACAAGPCLPGGETAPAWGMGSTCQASINDAIHEAMNLIPGSCDTCLTTPIEVTPCHVCGTHPDDPADCTGANDYRADYKVRYRCEADRIRF